MPMIPFATLRPAQPEDADAVEALLAASYPVLMRSAYDADLLARALPIMLRASPTLLRSGTYHVAQTAEGQLVGAGGWTLARPGAPAPIDPTLGHIRHFATHPAWTRRGIGRALLARCAADAQAAGVRQFECWSSRVAVAFYAAFGFRIVEPILVAMGPEVEFPAVRMLCPLGSASP
ncbi:GNAT family N-acetyltransferase [Methylobacterium nodulans]|uniref:GCN5-related N-acetyltransferase n=1 Tax=Methylobacterium nodulans (strain LMG 21967 / CNCM I-2342 / ORS 2060) TaxID=460265 RepID=B8IBW0_METNO|nr:GNAT family N-acetyltransferase [Methylobacterium nodulans]ACL61142.1 GCN5-related N-acetyltransferase [Methylobacterium nodulans ORS 2060]